MDRQRMAASLKRWRQWRGISQQEMARRLGMEPGAYAHWEAGRVELRARDLVKLAFALGMPLGTLLRALDFPVEDRVLSPGQWVDSGAPSPSGTIPTSPSGSTTAATVDNAPSHGSERHIPLRQWPFTPMPALARSR